MDGIGWKGSAWRRAASIIEAPAKCQTEDPNAESIHSLELESGLELIPAPHSDFAALRL